MEKDWNRIAKIERAITQKYGKDTVQNPLSNWTDEKEKEYLQQLEKLHEKDLQIKEQEEMVEVDGFLVSKKLLNRDKVKNCPVCASLLKNLKDDAYMIKYECCSNCYVQYVEDREERWLNGWRPETGDN